MPQRGVCLGIASMPNEATKEKSLGVANPIKESTPEAIRTLHDEGSRIVRLRGAEG